MYEIRRFLFSVCVVLQGDTKGSAKGGDASAKKEAHSTPISQVNYMCLIFLFLIELEFWCFLLTFSLLNSTDCSSRVAFPRS